MAKVPPYRLMKAARRLAMLAMVFAGLLLGLRSLARLGPEETASLVAGNNAFALDLYSRLKDGNGNLFFSPYSISACLATTYAGARGDTEKQMAQVLHFDGGQEQVARSFGGLRQQLNAAQKKGEIQLNITNGLWGQEGHPFLPAFLKTARQQYDAKLIQLDFATAAESARQQINDWVSDKTKGKITGLIPPGLLNGMTRLVLVNAIYFKGNWTHQFKKLHTQPAPFFVAADHETQTPLMNLTDNFKYAETDAWQLLEMSYVGNDISMVVLLPREKDGLKNIETALTTADLGDWLGRLRPQKVQVSFPKFKMTQQFALADTLSAMGMPAPFSRQSDFSGMDGSHDLFISAVVHKAYVDVNEEGTEAAAATGVAIEARAVRRPEPVPIFRADHPFIFLIRDTHSGSILFLGRMVEPGK